MKHIIMLIGTLLCLTLSACCREAGDLVVINESDRAVYSIVLEYENRTEGVMAANGTALMEPGQSYGLELEEGTVTVSLLDRAQRTIRRNRVTWHEGQRLFLTIDGVTEGRLSVEERPHAPES